MPFHTDNVPVLGTEDLVREMWALSKEKAAEAGTTPEPLYLIRAYVRLYHEAMYRLIERADPELRVILTNLWTVDVKCVRPNPTCKVPMTGERVYMPSRRKVGVSPSKRMKRMLITPLVDLGYDDPFADEA